MTTGAASDARRSRSSDAGVGGEVSIVHVHRGAPPKPAVGAPCNGCGLCCLAEPCPVGIALSGRRTGACAALRWSTDASRYRCGAITEPRAVLPAWLGWLAPVFAPLARRWIAAGAGCDSDVQAVTR